MSVTLQDIKLETVDFEWIKNTTKLSHLKRAIALIEHDGNYYTELKDACYARMEEIDPSCKSLLYYLGESISPKPFPSKSNRTSITNYNSGSLRFIKKKSPKTFQNQSPTSKTIKDISITRAVNLMRKRRRKEHKNKE